MSRNVDKANSVLARYQELVAENTSGYKDYSRFKRPTAVHRISNLEEAQRWRAEVVKDIGNKVTQIHDPSLNEMQIEDINNELNRLFQEKMRWESHIRRNLRGPDYRRMKQGLNTTGGTVINGTRYFGRALELPHVQELLQQQQQQRVKQQNQKQREQELRAKVRQWEEELGPDYYGEDVPPGMQEYEAQRSRELQDILRSAAGRAPQVQIPLFERLPTQEEVEGWLVERRRKRLQERLDL
ncbi:AFR363Wp [Eremothecium gossypii ATCC 10895]|uniref:Pre-mRNA-splicing factor ISY1 n=1 Tax=Eremothecium gossypii (strain ATCC 10895 / CBS 109.51 / FGSC 9923 / NRRL Y-1056) TaxID=284811 RepID=ISY1_EREGS|nr:AFR363Wp [Eremothecium gossypii ATCC 10895]Q753F1.1 RecName: Full=Pre-mRNA-splicing factor ISY1 [Eremothecium gossypii ATCC 10895]AAS53734.1 AFR363Wp [Eremothecium gossypii ATCC 10895]